MTWIFGLFFLIVGATSIGMATNNQSKLIESLSPEQLEKEKKKIGSLNGAAIASFFVAVFWFVYSIAISGRE